MSNFSNNAGASWASQAEAFDKDGPNEWTSQTQGQGTTTSRGRSYGNRMPRNAARRAGPYYLDL